ncbi:uncharacterized protein LOC130386682 [Gadus chalcogrammus]|uniref:uncharacterized protein LOC130386682 n=1 Tax=Gadus chalcogrammus TaxID=1042646 RepID=UPI0024C47CB4|nr:uncharacterized protein LOC130386682 [Gadus chalcogrammus]
MEPKPCHKVDQDVVSMMDEETLSKYIPHFGDRVFAKNWTGSASAEAGSNADKKNKLIERLRGKIKLPSSGQATASSSNHTCSGPGLGNKNAARKTRKIELGWMNYQDGYFRQVRRPTGGGTREIIARKDDTLNKILGDGKKIFFPKGKSSKGRVEDFDFTLCVMGSEEPLDCTLTVGALYDTTHHKILRLYICSKKSDDSDLSDSSAQAKSPERSQTAEAPTSPDLSPKSSSHTMSPECSWSSLSSDGPLSSSSPFMHAGVPSTLISNSTPTSLQTTSKPSMAQIFSLSPDNEVIFLDDDGNISLDVLCDTLIYQPIHASEQQASDNVIELQVDSNPAFQYQRLQNNPASDRNPENPESMTEVQSSNLVPTTTPLIVSQHHLKS